MTQLPKRLTKPKKSASRRECGRVAVKLSPVHFDSKASGHPKAPSGRTGRGAGEAISQPWFGTVARPVQSIGLANITNEQAGGDLRRQSLKHRACAKSAAAFAAGLAQYSPKDIAHDKGLCGTGHTH